MSHKKDERQRSGLAHKDQTKPVYFNFSPTEEFYFHYLEAEGRYVLMDLHSFDRVFYDPKHRGKDSFFEYPVFKKGDISRILSNLDRIKDATEHVLISDGLKKGLEHIIHSLKKGTFSDLGF